MPFLLLGDYKSPGFNRSNLFLRRISNPPGRLTEDVLNPSGRLMEDVLNPPGHLMEDVLNPPGRLSEDVLNPPGILATLRFIKNASPLGVPRDL